jgi:hypothetical protein
LPAFNKRPISERQIQADYIRKVNTAEGQAIKELHPELTEEAEDYAISSLLQINAGGYNSQVFNDPNTSSEFKKFFVEEKVLVFSPAAFKAFTAPFIESSIILYTKAPKTLGSLPVNLKSCLTACGEFSFCITGLKT